MIVAVGHSQDNGKEQPNGCSYLQGIEAFA